MTKRIPVGILGATGMAGQRYVHLLKNHPWFELVWLAASEQSAGSAYGDAVSSRWHEAVASPASVADMIVRSVHDVDDAAKRCSIVFSAMSTSAASEWEERYAKAGLGVVSNASAHRSDADVPVVVPEVNPEHLEVIPYQRRRRKLPPGGFIVCKPNCSVQSYLLPLHTLRDYGIRRVIVTTLQALSGAGHPGVSSLDVLDNVIPHIPGEEEKSEGEPTKILGTIVRGRIRRDRMVCISAHCNRVPVLDGHMACVSVEFERKPSRKVVMDRWSSYAGQPQGLNLPSAPNPALIVRHEADRPQPRRDRDAGSGMAVSVGRLRRCSVLDWRFVGLSHNTLRGAAGGGVLIAELLCKRGYVRSS